MATLNTRVQSTRSTATTFEGAPAVSFGLKKELERSVLSTLLWEDTYYESGVEIASRIADLVKRNKVEDVTDVALRAKYMGKLRHVPLFVIRELFRRQEARLAAGTVLADIITRPDDTTEFLAMWWKTNKDEPLAKQAKKALGVGLAKFDEYQLQKYKKQNNTVSLRDVFRIVHPKPVNKAQGDMWKKLVDQTIGAANTWEVALSAGADKKETFERLTKEKKLGGLATLRNLRNMRQSGMAVGDIKAAILAVDSKKLLPKDVVMAYMHNPEYARELEQLFFKTFERGDVKIKGSTVIHIDCSGSMSTTLSGKSEMTRTFAATALAMIAQEMFEDVEIYCFGSTVKKVPSIRGFGLFEAVRNANVGHSTMVGLSVDSGFKNRAFDRCIVITDEQGHDTVNLPKNAKGYMMNVAPYKQGIGYGNWIRIDGWSDNVLDYIVEYEKFSTENTL